MSTTENKPKAVGYVGWNIIVDCFHCGAKLHLGQYPCADVDNKEFGGEHDRIGLALFGGVDHPANWSGLSIPIKCCGCGKTFDLDRFET